MPTQRVKKVVNNLKADLSVLKKAQPKTQTQKPIKVKTSLPEQKKSLSAQKLKTSVKKTRSKSIPINSEDDIEITLPPSASLRLLEKVNLYKIWYRETLPLQVSSTARFFGFLFLGVGTTFAVSSHLMHTDLPPSVAALVCSAGVCEEIADEALHPGAPKISFLNNFSGEIVTDKDFALGVENTTNVSVILTHLQSGNKTELKPSESNQDYKYRVRVKDIVPGSYRLEAMADGEEARYIFSGPTFTLKPPTVVPEVTIPLPLSDYSTSTDELNNTISEIPSVDDRDSETEAETATVVFNNQVSRSPVSLTFETNSGGDYLVVTTGDFLPKEVSIYGRLNNTTKEVYLGQAHLAQNQWFFSLSAINLPKITQQFVASFEVGGVIKRTEAVTVNFETAEELVFGLTEELEIKKRKVDLSLLAIELSNDLRTTYYSDNAEAIISDDEQQFVTRALIDEINSTMSAQASVLNSYLLNYAAAYQGGKLYLTNFAKQAINNFAAELAKQIASSGKDDTQISAVETIILARLANLVSLVNLAEDRLTSETNTLISQDADSDGITDYDEITNYFTNPSSPDSDQDGVIDSIEIITFSDPLRASLVTYPDFVESYNGIISNEIVSITKSRPLILESDPSAPLTQYSIEGRGIPGSFVYLFDKENQIVGIIRTNLAGEFFYTVNEPPSLARASLKAALIDPQGKVVIISDEFFYNDKKNQLVAAVSDIFLADEELSSRLTSFNILTGSIALVALGFVLLLLAQAVKGRRQANIVLKKQNFAATT
ncbi:MAG TPA: hypothetical protein PKA42_03845 [Candidatus Paceibacterota bacterium]|nr:hypothetical protein [Candidatus Paceibacterota bacterium]HMO83270.1 hypothetical protein [Candidatus Paceibacterota bacterium]